MQMTKTEKKRRTLLEIKDLLTGAAFPFMIQLIFSASIILFAGYSGEPGIQITALLFGEFMLIGAYVVFGRQNGLTAYRKFAINSKKRELNSTDITAYFKTGEYALWRAVLIGVITVIPYVIFQFIQCVAPNTACEFILKYAFGWAVYPFILIGGISPWLNFVWIIVPIGVHTAAYVWGGCGEKARQQKIAETQEIKGRRK